MAWNFDSASDAFPRYRELWDEINRSQGNPILLDSMFVEPLIRQFGSEKTLLAIGNDGASPSLALFEQPKKGFWQTFQPSQAPLGLVVFGDPNRLDPAQKIRDLIRSLPGYALGISVLQQDPDFSCFTNLNGSIIREKLDYIDTPRLTLAQDWESYWAGRSKNLTHNLSRQRRRLKERGTAIELITDRAPDAVAEAIKEYGRLESSGWKGQEGSAVAGDNRQGIFYREMLDGFCRRGEAVIYRLLIDGTTVASDLCLERDGRMVILKTAYDESVQGLSLGLLLHEEIFRSLFREGRIKLVEFYGRVREWHTKWTDEVRTMYHINFYRHRWVAAARHLLKSSLG